MQTATDHRAPETVAPWEAPLTALLGSVALWATWFIFNDRLRAPGAAWYDWVRPAILVAGCLLSFVAAALLAARRRAGREIAQLAAAAIPLALAVGLVTVPFRLLGRLGRWFGDGAAGLAADGWVARLLGNPPALVLNLAVIAIIAAIAARANPGRGERRGRDGGER